MKSLRLLTFGLLFFHAFTFSQNHDLGGWYMYFANAKIGESPFRIHFELQDRNHFAFKDLDQFLTRVGLQYNYKDQITFTGGYGFIQSEMIGDLDMPKVENRIYQEALIPQHISKVRLQHRFRYEQRFIEGIDFKTRYRYSLSLTVPLVRLEEKNQKIFANIYNELFINGEKLTENAALFDRNRLYMGAGFRFNPNLALQMGYMNQIFSDFSQPKLMVSLHHNLVI